jgi:hypothetical protein
MSMLSRFATLGGAPTDPYWANVSLLLVGNGANGTTTNIKDSSSNNVTLTPVGNTVISTAQSKFNTGSSVFFDGDSDYISGPSGANFSIGANDFTIECWCFLTASKNSTIIDTRNSGSGNGLALIFNGSNQLFIFVNNTAYTATSNSVTLNTWSFVTLCRASGVVNIYINGVSGYSGGPSASITDNGCLIGAIINGLTVTQYNFSGYIYDLRFTKGVARYTSNFTPPTAPFPTQGP